MLLSAVIICCMIVANAEPPLNSYSYTGDSNGYDYNTITSNGYLGSKDSYQNSGNFYGVGDTSHKLSNHIGGHSLINAGNQGSIGGDVGNSYKGYSANDQGSEYGGYSNSYENSENSDSYTRTVTSTPFRGYSGSNGESTFNAYSNGPAAHKDTDFGQYASSSNSNSKRIPAFPGYSRPILENYPEGSDHSNVQGYHGSSGSSYSESDHAFSPFSPSSLEYSFGKQKDEPYKGGNKYSDIYSIPSETRYTRGNAGHANHNHDVPSYVSSSGPSGHFLKTYGSGPNVWYSSGKPGKYSYKYLSRYAPNTGVAYLSRERDGYYAPFNKGGGKLVIIKDTRPSYAGGHVYSDEPSYAGSYRSKSAGYATSPNFNGYSSNSSYDDGLAMLRRYRNTGGLLLQKAAYP